jgi:uncharacterized membrane protein YraQ (UPF0718 family)
LNSATLLLWGLALLLAFIALLRGRTVALAGLTSALERIVSIGPRVIVALLMAGFVAKLLPSEPIADLIGADSGFKGVLIASVSGGFVPAGPIISFPIAVVLYKAGAGIPQLIAFLTAWSVFAFHRVMIYESTLMGWRFSAIRLASSLILPPLSGLTAMGLMQIIPVN